MKKKEPKRSVADALTVFGRPLDRRLFLKRSLVLGSSFFLAPAVSQTRTNHPVRSPSMVRPGTPFSPYGIPSEHEKHVLRFPSANSAVRGNGVSWTPLHQLEGTITPSGLHYERHHNGVPYIDPVQHKLLVHGLVKRPLFFSVENLLRYPMVSRTCFIECGGNSNAGWHRQPTRAAAGYFHGLVSNSEWTGIPFATILNEAQLNSKAKWLIAEGADAFAMNVSIPVEKALDDALLALYQNGERIRPENGYPLRLVLPGWEGVLNVKWLRRIAVTAQPAMSRNETARYTELLPSGKARMFSFEMQAKSLITSPSSNMILPYKGLHIITGLAWSGRGKIKQVEVSVDGGRSWVAAELQQPVLSKSFTRFRFSWFWHGQRAVLQSRATDETGYVQPTRTALLAQRGRHGFFHYNAIVCWGVDEDGVVTHVYDQDETPSTGDITIDTGLWD